MSSIPDTSVLTQGEIDLFKDNGYLVKDGFLNHGLVERLTACLNEAIERRKAGFLSSMGTNYIDGDNSRIMHILNDDPAFLDMVDYPPALSIARTLMEGDVHFHASDAIWDEEVCPDALPRWHMDGREDGYRLFRPTVPLLQLKVGYYLSDMSDPDQGNLILVPQSHRREDDPPSEHLAGFDTFPGSTQICGVAYEGPGLTCWRASSHSLLRLRAAVDDRQRRTLAVPSRVLCRTYARASKVVPRIRV